jgi:cytochrome c biogenesis protein CcdA
MQEMIASIKSLLEGAGFGPASVVFSFALGMVSAVASSCCSLPIIGAMAGYSISRKMDRREALMSGLLFMAGSILALLIIGMIVAVFGISTIRMSGGYWKIVAGAIALLFGMGTIGLFPFKMPKFHVPLPSTSSNSLVSGISGLAFGGAIAAITLPCSPGFFVVLGAAVLQKHVAWAFFNLFAYALGFSVPLSALIFGFSLGRSAIRFQKAEKAIRITGGIILIAVGIYLFYSY